LTRTIQLFGRICFVKFGLLASKQKKLIKLPGPQQDISKKLLNKFFDMFRAFNRLTGSIRG